MLTLHSSWLSDRLFWNGQLIFKLSHHIAITICQNNKRQTYTGRSLQHVAHQSLCSAIHDLLLPQQFFSLCCRGKKKQICWRYSKRKLSKREQSAANERYNWSNDFCSTVLPGENWEHINKKADQVLKLTAIAAKGLCHASSDPTFHSLHDAIVTYKIPRLLNRENLIFSTTEWPLVCF